MKEITLKCSKLDFDGNGIVIYNNDEKKVPGLLEGETAVFEVVKKDLYTNLNLIRVTEPSKNRIASVCPEFLKCGGCQYLHMSYESELALKNEYVQDLFKTTRTVDISKVLTSDSPYNYRNKSQMTYKLSKSKQVVCGFYEERSHRIVPVTNCNIQMTKSNNIVNSINKILTKNKIMPYDEKSNNGIIRHVIIKSALNLDEVMVVFVTKDEFFPGRKNVVNDLIKLKLGITTIVQNYNPRDTSIVLGERERVLYGPGFIFDTIGEFKFKISSKSFYQVNPKAMEILYSRAIKELNISKKDTVLDTYCGVGTIGILVSKFAKQVYGVELNKDAYHDSLYNAKINHIKNIKFYNDDSTKFINSICNSDEKIDLLILDPPRDGSTSEFINAIKHLKPKRVAYISCEPKTLTRDLYDFTKIDYILKKIIPIDMFPRTFNLEMIALLELKNN
ncbi:MAG: 23S rRNA (uracil(1939)-C(5))-methyltransferase RlmD [Anaeroplasmataceae bacterium]